MQEKVIVFFPSDGRLVKGEVDPIPAPGLRYIPQKNKKQQQKQ